MCTHVYPESSSNLCSILGEEVALYCSKYLPDIIKEQKTYKDGKLQKVRGSPVFLCSTASIPVILNSILQCAAFLYFFSRPLKMLSWPSTAEWPQRRSSGSWFRLLDGPLRSPPQKRWQRRMIVSTLLVVMFSIKTNCRERTRKCMCKILTHHCRFRH